MSARSPIAPANDHGPSAPRLSALVDRWMRLVPRLHRGAALNCDLTPQQYMLLATLESHGALSLVGLQRVFGAAQSTLSEMVTRLATAGCVHKKPGPDDRRSVQVALTRRGRSKLCERREAIQGVHARVLDALTADERRGFLDALETMIELTDTALERMAEDDGDDPKE